MQRSQIAPMGYASRGRQACDPRVRGLPGGGRACFQPCNSYTLPSMSSNADLLLRPPKSHVTSRVSSAGSRWPIRNPPYGIRVANVGGGGEVIPQNSPPFLMRRRHLGPGGILPEDSREVASRRGPEEVARCQSPTRRVSRPPFDGEWVSWRRSITRRVFSSWCTGTGHARTSVLT